MAKGTHKNAYITKQAPGVDWSDWINKQEQTALYYNRLEKSEEEKRQKRQDELRKEFEQDTVIDYDLSSLGNETGNAIKYDMMYADMERLGELSKEMEGLNPRSPEYRDKKREFDRIQQNPDMLKLAFETLGTNMNTVLDEVNTKGRLLTKANKEKLDFYKDGKAFLARKKDGTWVLKIDKDKDGKADVDTQGNEIIQELNEGFNIDLGPAVYQVDEGAVIGSVAEGIAKKTFDEVNGRTTKTFTNSLEDRVVEGQTVPGLRTQLYGQFEPLLEDGNTLRALAMERGFEYDDLPDEETEPGGQTKESFKEKIKEEWLERAIPQIEQTLKIDVDRTGLGRGRGSGDDKGISLSNLYVGEKEVFDGNKGEKKKSGVHQFNFPKEYVPQSTRGADEPRSIKGFEVRDGVVTVIGSVGGTDYDTEENEKYIADYELSSDDGNNKVEIKQIISSATGKEWPSFDAMIKDLNSVVGEEAGVKTAADIFKKK